MILCSEAYFPNPGPRAPGTTQIVRHYHESEWLILLDPVEHLVHIRKKTRIIKDENDKVVSYECTGDVRSTDSTQVELRLSEAPKEVLERSKFPASSTAQHLPSGIGISGTKK